MKNKLILLVSIAVIGILFVSYMIPKIDARNNLDVLDSALDELKQDLPEGAVVWFIAKDPVVGPPEIYYKVQFALAPRIVMMPGEISDVPSGARVLVVDDQSKSGNELSIDLIHTQGSAFSVNRDGFTITILTKK